MSEINENNVSSEVKTENTEAAVAVSNEEKAIVSIEEHKTGLQKLAEERLEEIKHLNPDFTLDFMNVFTRLKVNSKGQFFYTLSGEETLLSDTMVVQLLAGEHMYQYWGEEGSEDEGELLCYSRDKKVNCDGALCSDCPYDPDKCKIRYALALRLLEVDEDPSEIYNINIPSTGTFAFSDYAKLLTKKRKSIQSVKTKVYTEEKTSKEDSKKKYNAILFKYVSDID